MNNRTDNKNNNSNITKVNKNNDHHLGEKYQMKIKKLVVHEKKKVFVLVDSLVKHMQGWGITKKLENKQSLYQAVCRIKSNLYEWLR